ncbi:MAG: FecR domain-containing protein [Proteobacteria bacterium]|nr:FecR domain-containing protein [Pseudomonadota bacterium]
MKKLIAPSIGVVFVCTISALALAATEALPVASVVDVVKDAFHTPPGGAEASAKVGDKLLTDEAIRTGPDSAIEMNFPDGATLRLEADSDLVLDSYVFDPSALKSAANISIPQGVARYTTGGVSTDDTGVQFSTPVATVGIRGTDIVVSVGANGGTVIDVLSGKVTAKPHENESVAEAEEGQSILIETEDQPPQVGTIGDFATAAGAPSESAPGEATDVDPRDQDKSGKPKGNEPASGGSSGGGSSGGGSSGGGSSGGGQSDSDGDGNSGHGDNPGKHDNDNPGNGGNGGNAGGGGNGGGNGGGKNH